MPDWRRVWSDLRSDPPHHQWARAARVGLGRGLWRMGATPRVWPELLRLGMAPIARLPRVHAVAAPDRLAWVDDRRAVTWREADRQIGALANALAERFGVGAGTRVLLLMENRVEYPLAWFALFRLGAVAVHASYESTAAELAWQVSDSGAALIIASDRAEAADSAQIPCVRCGPAFDALALGPSRRHIARASRDSVVFTSGTTGRPKGAVRDFGRLGPAEFFRLLDRLPLAHGERHLMVGRLYHSAGQAFLMLVASLGGTVFLASRFDAADVWRRLRADAIQSVFMVPTMIRRLLEAPVHAPLPALRVLISGAAPFPEALRRAAIERIGAHRLFDFYGATELGWVTLCDGVEMRARPGTVGRALAGQVLAIRDANGIDCPTGTIGQVWVRNQQSFAGYIGRRPARSDGWSSVEDLGRLDPDGYLYLAGRAGDMVVSGGVNLYPPEIEAVLGAHPQVAEVAVVGIPDAVWGERLLAVVVPRGALDVAALEAWARVRLSGAKVPRRWRLVDALPRNATGKVLKRTLTLQGDPPA